MTGRYGWKKDQPDQRDRRLSLAPAAFPPYIDLRSGLPAVYDQGNLGCCVYNAIGAAVEFDHWKQGIPAFPISRLFGYYIARELDGTVDSDSGISPRDGFKVLATNGMCHETLWPYDIEEFAIMPSAAAFRDAVQHRALSYWSLSQDLMSLRACLVARYPFLFGFSVYESFESDQVAASGIVPMPSPDERMAGGHCCLAIGYNEKLRAFLCRNSWGASWGLNGHFFIPYEYLLSTDLAGDMWTLRRES